ncbi:MAG: hypothetical protein FWB95_02440 [Treponema sp.]|nr:hypothetical protein [Treponema sp.]
MEFIYFSILIDAVLNYGREHYPEEYELAEMEIELDDIESELDDLGAELDAAGV